MIGLDISQIAHPGGVANYTRNLGLKLEQKLGDQIIFFYSSLRQPLSGSFKKVKKFPFPPTLFELIFNELGMPIEVFLGKLDLFHSSDWIQPKTNAKKVTTYHDLVPIVYPQWSTKEIVRVHRKRLERVEKEIDQVIAVSQATKADLVKFTKIPEGKIKVIYEGVGEEFGPQSEEAKKEFRKSLNLPNNFLLAIGGIGQRRNLDRLKEASRGHQLVITGETIPWIADSDRPLLYSCASALVYPSLYEGFGLPVLEAFACGVPVITSNVSSLPEVGGKAAIYVDPTSLEEIKQAIDLVQSDKGLREDLIKKGLARAKEFTWDKCADETINLYQGALR